jgi:hypothetical protein
MNVPGDFESFFVYVVPSILSCVKLRNLFVPFISLLQDFFLLFTIGPELSIIFRVMN